MPADALLHLLRARPDALGRGIFGRATLPKPVQEAMAVHPSRKIRSALAGHPDADLVLRAALLTDDDWLVRLNVLTARDHPPLPADALIRVMSEACDLTAESLLTAPEFFEEILFAPPSRLDFAARHPDPRVRLHVTYARSEMLLDDPDPQVATAAAEAHTERNRPRVPADLPQQHCHAFWTTLHLPLSRELAEQVVASGDLEAMASVAANPTTPPDLIETLSRHPHGPIREALTHQDLIPEQVRRLAHDADPTVRRAIATRPGLPDDLIRSLAADPDQAVRTAIEEYAYVDDDDRAALELSETDLPRAIRWARSDNPRLRRRSAAVPGLPSDLVAILTDDPDPAVRRELATNHPDAPGELLLRCFLEGQARHVLPARPRFPVHGLARFADHEDPQVRRLALRDPALDPSVAERLTRDRSERVRTAAARCPLLPADRIAALLDDPELAVDAAANPSLQWEAALERVL